MRALLILAVPLIAPLASCSADLCAGEAGVCITARVEGQVAGLDSLEIRADALPQRAVRTPDPARALALPVEFAVALPAGTAGPVELAVLGLAGGVVRAAASQSVTISGDRGRATFTLSDAAAPDRCVGVFACQAGDGCCPGACSANQDADCPDRCGNGALDKGEVCDGGEACEATCSSTRTLEVFSGRPLGSGYADATGRWASFNRPLALASDGKVLWVADRGSGAVRQIDPASGAVTTLAGGPPGRTSKDGNGKEARFLGPFDLAYSATDNLLYVADSDPNSPGTTAQIRKIFLGDPNRPVTTLIRADFGSFKNATALVLGRTSTGDKIAVLEDGGLRGFRTNGGSDAPVASAAALSAAAGTAESCYDAVYAGTDGADRFVYYVGCSAVLLRVITTAAQPELTIFAGKAGTKGCADAQGPRNATLSRPTGLSVDADGSVIFVDAACGGLRRASTTAVATLIRNTPSGLEDGTLGASGTARIASPQATGRVGNDVYFTDQDRVRRLSPSGVTTLAGSSILNLSFADSGEKSTFTYADGLVSDGKFAYALVTYLRQVFRVSLTSGASQAIFTFSGGNPPATPRPMALLGDQLYVAFDDGTVRRIGTDGSGDRLFLGVSRVSTPILALIADDKQLYYGDVKGVVGTIDSSGVQTPIAGEGTFARPRALATTGGSLYVLDGPVGASNLATVVRRVELATGAVTTIAGSVGKTGAVDGAGTKALFAGAAGLTSDGASLFIADPGSTSLNSSSIDVLDSNGPAIRQLVLRSGAVSTFVGRRAQFGVVPGVGTAAGVYQPGPLFYDAASKALLGFDQGCFFRVR